MLSWTSPHLHGSPAASHNEYLSLPLTAEDLPHVLVHRDFWLVQPGRPPFALSGLSPDGLRAHLHRKSRNTWIEAGPGWFSLARRDPAKRFSVRATLWCPADLTEKVELMRIEVTNTSSKPVRFQPYAAIPLFARSADNVRDHRHVTALLHRIFVSRHGITVCPTMSFDERGHRINTTRYSVLAVGPHGAPPNGIWPTEVSFLGEGGNFAAPAAVWRHLSSPPIRQTPLAGRDAIGGFRFAHCTLRPGARATYVLLCGISRDARDGSRWFRWMQRPEAAARSFARTKAAWRRKSQRLAFFTSDRTLDHWLTWVNVQPIFRRLYGNSFLPQFDYGRGGRGWRDLWQDGLALLLSDPSSVRAMLLHNFGGVRIDGSNATIIGNEGRFLADRNNIPRTWMDHGAWPTFTTLLYIHQTGDLDVLLTEREYFRDPQLFRCRQQDPRWTDAYGFALRTRRGRVYRGSIFEHLLVQNLTAFLNVGEHNVCRLEGADWNDGLDMACHRGESVAFSAFYAWNLERLAQLADRLAASGVHAITVAEELGLLLDRLPHQRPLNYHAPSAKRARLEQYLDAVSHDVSGRTLRIHLEDLARDLRAKHRDLAERIQRREWVRANGEAFFNGYYDDGGRRVEGAHPSGVRMTLTGQVFPLMSGIATEEHVAHVMRSVTRFLRDPRSGGVRLNTNFGSIQPHLGRAFSFAYGEKENGAVFSHMAVMYAFALYLRRRAEEGRRVWSALYAMATNQDVAHVFPCLPEYFNADGRGMYSYLTGSASWLIYLLLSQMYGIRGEWGDLVIDPQLTSADFGACQEVGVALTFADRRLRVRIVNSEGLSARSSTVISVRRSRTVLPTTPRPEGGVLVRRQVVAAFPTHGEIELRVTLGRRR